MSKMQQGRCHRFLLANGWRYDNLNEGDYCSYVKEGLCAIDMDSEEIVFIDDSGDFLHVSTNYYTLIGVLIESHQLSFGYRSVS
jgi:hypothetical protein